MAQRLAEFFLVDDAARWRAILWSWLSGSIAGAIAATSTTSLDSLAFVSVGVSLAVFGGFLFSYGTAHRIVAVQSRRAFMDYAYAAVAAVSFTVLQRVLTNPETVHAAAVHIGDAINGRTPVREDQIGAVRAALKVISQRDTTPAMKKRIAADYSVVSAAEPYNRALISYLKNPAQFRGFTIDLGGSGGTFLDASEDGDVLVDHMTVIADSPASHGIHITCTSCAVVVLDAVFKRLSQTLDRGTWFKCGFADCEISYLGGPIVMVECKFIDCSFIFSSSVSAELRHAIQSGTVTVPTLSGL